jgi:PAS domain S-box-containing protein
MHGCTKLPDLGVTIHDYQQRFTLRLRGGQPLPRSAYPMARLCRGEAFEVEERFESMFNANPAPALIVRLADLRYVRVNEGFIELSGWERDQIVGRSPYDFDILEQAAERDKAKARLEALRRTVTWRRMFLKHATLRKSIERDSVANVEGAFLPFQQLPFPCLPTRRPIIGHPLPVSRAQLRTLVILL